MPLCRARMGAPPGLPRRLVERRGEARYQTRMPREPSIESRLDFLTAAWRPWALLALVSLTLFLPGIDALRRHHQARLPKERQHFEAWWKRWRETGGEAAFVALLKPS